MATINCDMGEAFGLYRMGDDAGLMPLIDIANVACGFHASDFNHMRSTVRLAKAHGVAVGAHPSLPDLQGFGRREMKIGREELANCLIYQIGALKGFLDAEGMKLNHIKPHGSLYGMAARNEDTAHAICDAADVFKTPCSAWWERCMKRSTPLAAIASWPNSTPTSTTATTEGSSSRGSMRRKILPSPQPNVCVPFRKAKSRPSAAATFA